MNGLKQKSRFETTTTPSTFSGFAVGYGPSISLRFCFSFASVPNDLPFCRTEFTATFRSDGPWPPERSEAEKLIRDDDNAFDFPLLSDFADGYVKGYSQRVQSKGTVKGYSQRVTVKG